MKTIARWVALALALVLVTGVFAACQDSTQTSSSTTSSASTSTGSQSTGNATNNFPETIKFAFIGPLTGNFMLYGTNMSNAVKLIIEQVNEAGGIQSMGGAKLTVDIYDDKNDPKETVTMASKVLADPDYVVCIGPFATGNGLAIKTQMNEAGMCLISPSISNVNFAEDEGDYMIGAGLTQQQMQKLYSEFMYNELGYRKGILMTGNNENGKGQYDQLNHYFTEVGGELVHVEFYEQGTKDFKSQIAKFKTIEADFIYVGGQIAECGPIVNQIRELQIDLPILSSNSLQMQEYLDIVGENGEGQTMMSYYSPGNDNPQAFEDFRTKFNATYENKLEAHAYGSADITLMLVQMLEEMGTQATPPTTPAEIKEAFHQMIPGHTGIHGLMGDYSYDNIGQIQKTYIPIVVQDGKFVKWDKSMLG